MAAPMLHSALIFSVLLHLAAATFIFPGFSGTKTPTDLILSGNANLTSDGLLRLTNTTTTQQLGHAFYRTPLRSASSFSTTFVFAIVPPGPGARSDHGMAFVCSSSPAIPGAFSERFLGLFNSSTFNTTAAYPPASPVFAVEFDVVQNREVEDIDDNHVGIDVNSLISAASAPASVQLSSGEPIQAWIEYNASRDVLEVRLAPLRAERPEAALISFPGVNLSSIFPGAVYVGFSASTGGATATHYVLGWSFGSDGQQAPSLDPDRLPRLPELRRGRKVSQTVILGLAVVGLAVVLAGAGAAMWWRRKFAEVEEEWERSYGPNRVAYRVLYRATRGFRTENVVGEGGFGKVYRGTLPGSMVEVAVKKIAHDSTQGVREFVTEITSMARLRHRNLVHLQGYCRRRGELLLVYEYMENGSLDKLLHGAKEKMLNWAQRVRVAKGVAEGLLYLHEGSQQVVIHRDIKASNVLLNRDLDACLGDFGLAKIYDRGDANLCATTRVVGTPGYIAPELTRSSQPTTFTDVYAFGAFLLEVACGKRPIWTCEDNSGQKRASFLLDWVMELSKRGEILAAMDQRLDNDYSAAEAELVLKLGLLCSNELPESRPTMRQVVQFLTGEVPLNSALPVSGAPVTAVAVEEEATATSTSFPSPVGRSTSGLAMLELPR